MTSYFKDGGRDVIALGKVLPSAEWTRVFGYMPLYKLQPKSLLLALTLNWSLSPWPWGWTFGPDFDLSTEPLITSLQINDKTVLIDAFVKFHLPLKWIYYLNRTSAMFFGRKNTKTHFVQKNRSRNRRNDGGCIFLSLAACILCGSI